MNLKNCLFGIFSMLTFVTYSQSEKSQGTKSDCTITEYKIDTNNIKELEEFNWESVYDVFENNDPSSNINLQVGFNQKTKLKNSTIEPWNFSISGKTSELESMIEKSKNMISKMSAAKKH